MAGKILKELRPGVLGTPGVFSKELIDSLPMEYRPPKGGKFNVNTMTPQAKKKLANKLKIAAAKKKKDEEKA